MARSLLRHAAMACTNACRGLPQSFADGRRVTMPDDAARRRFAARAQHFAAAAAGLDGGPSGATGWHSWRVARVLPAAAPTTGNLNVLEDDPYWRAERETLKLRRAGQAGI